MGSSCKLTPTDRNKRRAPRQQDGAAPLKPRAQEDGPRVVSLPKASMHDESLPYSVELWDPPHRGVTRILGQAASLALATAIYDAALQEFPGRLVTLSRGGQQLRPAQD